jgi:hypothetical protein
MYWNPPKFLQGAAVAVLGGGPSLTIEQVNRVRRAGYRVIGVNDAYQFGNSVDICFFGDRAWYLGDTEGKFRGHAQRLAGWHGLIVTCSPDCVQLPQIHGLLQRNDPGLWPPPCCRWYRNSGFSAIGFAVTLGAVEIVLLGFDGREVNGLTHWHMGCLEKPDNRVFMEHHKSAQELMDDIARYPGGKGVRILNCTPDSGYAAFEQAGLDEVLGDRT